jgi:hypothetical protein
MTKDEWPWCAIRKDFDFSRQALRVMKKLSTLLLGHYLSHWYFLRQTTAKSQEQWERFSNRDHWNVGCWSMPWLFSFNIREINESLSPVSEKNESDPRSLEIQDESRTSNSTSSLSREYCAQNVTDNRSLLLFMFSDRRFADERQ